MCWSSFSLNFWVQEAALKVQQFFDKMNEEVDLMIAASEGRKPEADRVERIASLKSENVKLAGRTVTR